MDSLCSNGIENFEKLYFPGSKKSKVDILCLNGFALRVRKELNKYAQKQQAWIYIDV